MPPPPPPPKGYCPPLPKKKLPLRGTPLALGEGGAAFKSPLRETKSVELCSPGHISDKAGLLNGVSQGLLELRD